MPRLHTILSVLVLSALSSCAMPGPAPQEPPAQASPRSQPANIEATQSAPTATESASTQVKSAPDTQTPRPLLGTAYARTRAPKLIGPFWKKNYKVGGKSFADVGEPIVRATEYWVSSALALRPIIDFELTAAGGSQLLRPRNPSALDLYKISGTLDVAGVKYRVLDELEGLLVAPDGTATTSRDSDNEIFPVESSPSDISFKDDFIREVRNGRSFELLYSGIDGSSIKVSYREFTSDGLARPAFSQELSYDKSASEIVFRDIKIAVSNAGSTKISYTVLEDGLPEEQK